MPVQDFNVNRALQTETPGTDPGNSPDACRETCPICEAPASDICCRIFTTDWSSDAYPHRKAQADMLPYMVCAFVSHHPRLAKLCDLRSLHRPHPDSTLPVTHKASPKTLTTASGLSLLPRPHSAYQASAASAATTQRSCRAACTPSASPASGHGRSLTSGDFVPSARWGWGRFSGWVEGGCVPVKGNSSSCSPPPRRAHVVIVFTLLLRSLCARKHSAVPQSSARFETK